MKYYSEKLNNAGKKFLFDNEEDLFKAEAEYETAEAERKKKAEEEAARKKAYAEEKERRRKEVIEAYKVADALNKKYSKDYASGKEYVPNLFDLLRYW